MKQEQLNHYKTYTEYYLKLYQTNWLSDREWVLANWFCFYLIWPEDNLIQVQPQQRYISDLKPSNWKVNSDPFLFKLFQKPIESMVKKQNIFTLQNLTFLDFLNAITLKNTKTIAIKALLNWHHLSWPIHVVNNEIPTPIQLLKMQTQGKRCVSILSDTHFLDRTYDHNRNALQFLVHDLEHAWQMFSNSESLKNQIKCFQVMEELLNNGQLNSIRNENSQYSKELEYIFSDMNTHPAHTQETLKSLILRHFKSQRSTNELTFEQHHEWMTYWSTFETSFRKKLAF